LRGATTAAPLAESLASCCSVCGWRASATWRGPSKKDCVAACCGAMAHRAQPRSRVAGCPVRGRGAGCFAAGLCDALRACVCAPQLRPSDGRWVGGGADGGDCLSPATALCGRPSCPPAHAWSCLGGLWRTCVAELAPWRAHPSVQLRVRPVLHSCAPILRRSRIRLLRDGRAAGGWGVACRYHAARGRSWALCAFETARSCDVALFDPGMCRVPATRARRACGSVCLVAACAVCRSPPPIGTGFVRRRGTMQRDGHAACLGHACAAGVVRRCLCTRHVGQPQLWCCMGLSVSAVEEGGGGG
jgi:hypothetical protein